MLPVSNCSFFPETDGLCGSVSDWDMLHTRYAYVLQLFSGNSPTIEFISSNARFESALCGFQPEIDNFTMSISDLCNDSKQNIFKTLTGGGERKYSAMRITFLQ